MPRIPLHTVGASSLGAQWPFSNHSWVAVLQGLLSGLFPPKTVSGGEKERKQSETFIMDDLEEFQVEQSAKEKMTH